MKRLSIICIVIVLVAAIVLFVGIYSTNKTTEEPTTNNKEILINNESTAIKIASAVIAEQFPDSYERIKNDLTAQRQNEVWRVYNEVPQNMMGGVIYVELSAYDGRILSIGLEE